MRRLTVHPCESFVPQLPDKHRLDVYDVSTCVRETHRQTFHNCQYHRGPYKLALSYILLHVQHHLTSIWSCPVVMKGQKTREILKLVLLLFSKQLTAGAYLGIPTNLLVGW